MGTKIEIFGKIKVLKKNPWLSGKLLSAVKAGLAKIKKQWILADLPPWFGDPSKLSPAQIYQVIRFSKAAHEIRGKGTLLNRLRNIKAKASGPTGMAQPKVKPELPKIGKIISIARAHGISVPPELMRAPAPAPAPEQAAVIRE